MPYIPQNDRETALKVVPTTPGELNFVFTDFIKRYVEVKGLSYQTINDVYGALTGAQLEFARRVVNNYEDEKIKSNGDVY